MKKLYMLIQKVKGSALRCLRRLALNSFTNRPIPLSPPPFLDFALIIHDYALSVKRKIKKIIDIAIFL